MLPSQIPIDEMFDLDSALTMPDLPNQTQQQDDHGSNAAAVHLLDQMPTVEGAVHCAVCVDRHRLGVAAKRIPCGHVFHHDCISRWLSLNYSCPLCREKCPPPGKFTSD